MARLAVLACLVLAFAASSSAQPDTTGKQFSAAQGYTFGSNVGGYLAVSKDVCDFEAALKRSPPDFAGAEKIYTTGGNSKKSDGSIRTLKSLTGPFTGEPFFDLYARFYGSPAFMDSQVMAALNGAAPFTSQPARLEGSEKSVETMLQWVYLMHELDEAAEKIRNNQLSASSGAPHNIDETWALFVGEAKSCGLYDQVMSRAANFGTQTTCSTAKATELALSAHIRMYRAAQEGDLRAFERARKDMERVMMIQCLQATLRYSNLMERDMRDKNDVLMADHQAEGFVFFRTIAPLVNMTNPATAREVLSIMTPGAPVATGASSKVATALEPVYAKWNLTAEDMGTLGAQSPIGTCVNATATSAAAPLAARFAPVAAAAAGAVFVALF